MVQGACSPDAPSRAHITEYTNTRAAVFHANRECRSSAPRPRTSHISSAIRSTHPLLVMRGSSLSLPSSSLVFASLASSALLLASFLSSCVPPYSSYPLSAAPPAACLRRCRTCSARCRSRCRCPRLTRENKRRRTCRASVLNTQNAMHSPVQHSCQIPHSLSDGSAPDAGLLSEQAHNCNLAVIL